jgi:hypothetical protein
MENIEKTNIPESDKECFAYYEFQSLSTIKLYTQSKMAPKYIQSLFETRDEQHYKKFKISYRIYKFIKGEDYEI